MNLRLFKLLYQKWWRGTPPSIPYNHVVQIGDPVLRQQAKLVDSTIIQEEPMQKLLSRLYNIMKKTKALGMAAPQIGVSLRVFAIQCPSRGEFKPTSVYDARQMEYIPLQVWINPEIKILDYQKSSNEECCCSMKGFSADIPRYTKVLITGLDHEGKQKSWEANGWSARIVQHEMDHLNGKFFTDLMDPKTLSFTNWEIINRKEGRIYTTYMLNK